MSARKASRELSKALAAVPEAHGPAYKAFVEKMQAGRPAVFPSLFAGKIAAGDDRSHVRHPGEREAWAPSDAQHSG